MGNPVVMNCSKIVMKCSLLSIILHLTRMLGKRRLRFFTAFPMECVSGKQGECSHTRHFRLAKMLVGVAPVTSCQGLFNTVHRIFKKLTQQKPGALWLPACSCGSYSCAIIWRTSSRSIRLIFSSMVSVLVSLKCAHTR